MSTHEVVAGFMWIYSVLSIDATLLASAPGGVYRSLAPPITASPYVIMAHQSGMDVVTINAFRLMDNLLYQVKAVGPSSQMVAIAAAAARIDQLLGLASGTVTGGYIGSCYREQPIFVDESPINGEQYTNVGGLYRLQIKQM